MKKLFVFLMMAGVMSFGISNIAKAQDEGETEQDATEAVAPAPVPAAVQTATDDLQDEQETFHQLVKEKFIEGGWEFMSVILTCLILGLAIVIERIITLNLASTNTKKLLMKVDEALAKDGIEGAKEVCKNTRGPVASIFTQGLLRMSEGIDIVEKSIIAYGSVEMGRLERGLVWISLFIALAPMLGFLGTVIGMVLAFDAIEAASDINPALVAGGIKVALITTVAGLIVAIILQIFYNYLVTKIDSLVNQMEDASISLVDLLVKYNLSK
jgi:biopolymer transport protein ExbB